MYYLGIDIGGTKVQAVLLEGLKPQKPKCFVMPTLKRKKEFLASLEKFIAAIAGNQKIAGIGAGVPGAVDRKRGILIKAPHLPFLDGWRVSNFFQKFSGRVRVDNDSRCFLRAEALWGAAKEKKNVVGVAIGTGIGGGIIIGGEIYYGVHNSAGEFGHTIIYYDFVRDHAVTFEELGAKAAAEKWGDRSAVIGVGVANLINIFDPDMVVLGGGGVIKGGVRIDTVRDFARKYTMSTVVRKIPIVRGIVGDAAQAIGAALLFKVS